MSSAKPESESEAALTYIIDLLCADTRELISRMSVIAKIRADDKVATTDDDVALQKGGYVNFLPQALWRMMHSQDRNKSLDVIEALYRRVFSSVSALEMMMERANLQCHASSVRDDVEHALGTLLVSISDSLKGLLELRQTYRSDPGTSFRIEHLTRWIVSRIVRHVREEWRGGDIETAVRKNIEATVGGSPFMAGVTAPDGERVPPTMLSPLVPAAHNTSSTLPSREKDAEPHGPRRQGGKAGRRDSEHCS